jgi:hypothetical protein
VVVVAALYVGGHFSILEMRIPNYVPTASYSIMVTATGGGVTRSCVYTLSVLAAQVTVSGKITTVGIRAHPTGIMFVSKRQVRHLNPKPPAK